MADVPYDYIAYIDEAGDPGLRRVKPLDENGSSEWLIVAGVLVRKENEAQAKSWNSQFIRVCGSKQTRHLHFRKLPPEKQVLACRMLGSLPVRAFVVASNKKNMKGHQNIFADRVSTSLVGKVNRTNWYYYWLTRVLLEKMTDYVYRHSMTKLKRPGQLKIEFSERGGLRYDEIELYYRVLREHDRAGTQHVKYDALNWDVMNGQLIEAHPQNSRAGLVLPDIVASSFFVACDKYDRGSPPDPTSAFLLDPRMARRRELPGALPNGYGVKLMPSLKRANLDDDQARIFHHYGY